jgi:hypothetical protein
MRFLLFSTSFTLYLTGDFISKLFYLWGAFSVLYPLYNYLMSLSIDIDDKYNLGVWE